MAKHTRGKHSKPKAAMVFNRSAKGSQGKPSSSSKDAEVKKRPSKAASSGNLAEDIIEVDVVGNAAKDSIENDASKPHDDATELSAQASKSAPAASDDSAASDQRGDSVEPVVFMSTEEQLASAKAARRKTLKHVGIAALVWVVILAVVYFGGVIFFFTHFMPNTYISNMDVSLETPEDVGAEISSKVANYTVKVKGHGLNVTFTAEDAGMDIDAKSMTDAVAGAQDPWAWPIEVFKTRDMTDALTESLSASTLSDVVHEAVAEVNETATPPENAKVQFNQASGEYVIIEEVDGTQLDPEKVLEQTIVKLMNLEDQVIISSDALVQPAILSDDPRVVAAADEANALTQADIDLKLGSNDAGKIDALQISAWVTIDPEFNVSFNEDAMNQWAGELAAKFNTVGSSRTYTRSDGKTITVKGGDYGWSIDSRALISEVKDAILEGAVKTIDIPVLKSGQAYNAGTGRDWGARYIDVDISEQYARFYGDDGSIIWESSVVTGAPTPDRATPQGVFDLNHKEKNVTLIGSDADNDGEPDYETKVSFWMPFKGNSVGFHDATWQSSFGGSRYRNGAGSHGCVNLPYSKAESLYDLIRAGDVVVVHS